MHLNPNCTVDSMEMIDLTSQHVDDASARTEMHHEAIKKTLVNCAVDRTLAAAIFLEIVPAGTKYTTPIQHVELSSIVRSEDITESGIDGYSGRSYSSYRHFARRWKCSFNPREDRSGEVVVEETEKGQLERKQNDDAFQGGNHFHAPMFRSIWSDQGTGDWRDDWKSFPLQAL
ncbi:hypothetical protein Slin14017_G092880 [Septoria linicola]|nr:hypothetical protein Slin14017_G092880 [Septoria linicola]